MRMQPCWAVTSIRIAMKQRNLSICILLRLRTLLSTGAVSFGMRPVRSSQPTPVQISTSFRDAAHVAASTTWLSRHAPHAAPAYCCRDLGYVATVPAQSSALGLLTLSRGKSV